MTQRDMILQVMGSDPRREWSDADIAEATASVSMNATRVLLSRLSRAGVIERSARRHYRLTSTGGDPPEK